MEAKKTCHIAPGPFRIGLELRPPVSIPGFALAAAALVSCCIWASPAAGLLFACLLSLLAVVRLEIPSCRGTWVSYLTWALAAAAAMSFIGPAIVGCALPLDKLGLNMLCCGAVLGLFLAVTGAWRLGLGLGCFALLALGIANGYVYIFREREFSILDIFTATTAMKVAQQYTYTPTRCLLYAAISGFCLIYSLVCLPKATRSRPARLRLGAVGAASLCLLGLYGFSLPLTAHRWDNEGSEKNGTYLNIFLGIRDCRARQPQGYDPAQISQAARSYPQAAQTAGPNILVIMNESYCDLGVYPYQPDTNISVTPYWDSLEENAIKGHALSSVYGGNTVNSEFEFLTGFSMAFLPTGAVPYSQYTRSNTYSLAWVLRSYGYTALASHNYYASGWERERVYPLLGFEKSTFLEAYPQADTPRGFVSDREQYEYLLGLLDEEESPAFLFAVTMQNHGGYTNPRDTYDHTVTITGDAASDSAEQYLSMLNASDQALEHLLTSLENSGEDTIVLVFGDHQPKLPRSFYEALNGSPLDTLQEQQRQYTVPFLIWANYDIPEAQLELTSLNYLAGHLLDAAGLARPAYLQYLGQLEKTVPAMNLLGYYSHSLGAFLPYTQAVGAELDALLVYQQIQYNGLMDRKHASKAFFSQYLPEE